MTPWPHQVRAFERLYERWPPKLLIADEVGLGKTIQAGMLLRQAWLAGRAKRILILAPKAILRQWQIELREKFNLNWPIYDGRKMVRYPSPALREKHEREADRDGWHKEPVVIASSHLMRRHERAAVLLEAEPWDWWYSTKPITRAAVRLERPGKAQASPTRSSGSCGRSRTAPRA